jgi:putative phage-type endonuclease
MLTEAQLEARKAGIGGTDAAVVVGLSPFKSPYQLCLEKMGVELPDEEETLAMELGNILEEPVVQLYRLRTGRAVRRQPMVAHDDYPWMLANIDRQIINDPRGPGIYEGKTTNEWSGREIHGANDVPDHYYIQAQHYMAVYDYAWASFGVLIGTSRFVWFDIDRNDDVIAELIKQEAEFWERVQTRNPPPVDGSTRTADLIKRMYPKDTGKVLTVNAPELIEAANSLVALKTALKGYEADQTRYENMLKNACGDASEMILEGFGSITWKRAKDSVSEKLNVEKLKATYPDAYAACLEAKTRPGSRRFLIKPAKEAV